MNVNIRKKWELEIKEDIEKLKLKFGKINKREIAIYAEGRYDEADFFTRYLK